MYKKILVPVDGSEACDSIIEHVKAFGEKYEATILLLNVYGLPHISEYGNYPAYPLENAYSAEKQSEELLSKIKNAFGTVSFNIETLCECGNPAATIVDIAEREDCDLIIMCTHGMGAVKRFLMGSVTNKVVHHAHIPVLVIR